MCGIAGLISAEPVEEVETRLNAMLDAQLHRGPDDHGVNVLRQGLTQVGMGSRRLAIQDVSPAGHQPMANPDTHDVLVYNGEIYNFRELRRSLEGFGYLFRGGSDTEVLLRAYEQWGTECLTHLAGMFAFALWDARRNHLVLARDPLGIKPLYYTRGHSGSFLWASEIRALLASGAIAREIDRQALAGYLAFGAVQEPLTIIAGVTSLTPGTTMEVDALGRIVSHTRYWDVPTPQSDGRPVADVAAEGRSRLEEAMAAHLVSDVPVGVFLSSGLDSTTVLGLAQRVTTAPVSAFTVALPGSPEHDEAAIARATAARLGVAYTECAIDEGVALDWILDGLGAMDQPALDGLNTYIVARAAHSAGLVVALSGLGGDELFGGYRSFRQVPRWREILAAGRFLPPPIRGALAGALAGRDGVGRRKARDIARSNGSLLSLYLQFRRVLSDEDLGLLGINATDLGLASTYQPDQAFPAEHVPADPVASIARFESRFYLANTLLRDSDVYGMANSIEIRVPFLDRRVVEWALSLPGDAILPKDGPFKPLLRHMGAEFFDDVQTSQDKRGFVLPFAQWLQGPLRDFAHDSLASLKSAALVEPKGLDAIAEMFVRYPRSAAWSRIWTLVALGFWVDNVLVDRKGSLR